MRGPGASTTAAALADIVARLQAKDQVQILQSLGDTATARPVEAQGFVEAEVAKDAVEKNDVPYMQMHWATALFLLLCNCMILFFARVIYSEHMRYSSERAERQGSFKAYLLYRFGDWYAWTPGSAGIVLMCLSLALLLVGGLLLRALTGQATASSLWAAWCWIAAPDGGGSADTVVGRLVGIAMSCGGMLFFALLMSVVSSGFEDALASLRAGSLPVIEGGHLVVLGSGPCVPILIEELCRAAESRGGSVIAILSNQPKPEVEAQLQESEVDFKGSTVVVRSGEMHRAEDLAKVGTVSAGRVVILSNPSVSREEADVRILNVLLTLRNMQWPREGVCVVHCELVRNQRLFRELCGQRSQVITVRDNVGTLMVQSSCQRGLASVVQQIVGYEGDDFYISHVEGAAGKIFRDLLFGLPGVILVGIVPPHGPPQLLPPMGRVILPDDQLLMLAEDASTVPTFFSRVTTGVNRARKLLYRSGRDESHIIPPEARQNETELAVVLGWNESIGAVIEAIDKFVGPGSQVVIYAPRPVEKRMQFLNNAQKRRSYRYQNLTIEHREGSIGARFQLEDLPLASSKKILILADDSAKEGEEDLQTAATILQIQDILKEQSGGDVTRLPVIVPQLLQSATEEALRRSGLSDVINSNRLSAQLTAMVCESPTLSGVITELLSEWGCQFGIRELTEYPAVAGNVALAQSAGVSFDEVLVAAALAGEIAIGWSAVGAGASGPWEMNPKDRERKRPWMPTSRVVAIRHGREQGSGARRSSDGLGLGDLALKRPRPS